MPRPLFLAFLIASAGLILIALYMIFITALLMMGMPLPFARLAAYLLTAISLVLIVEGLNA